MVSCDSTNSHAAPQPHLKELLPCVVSWPRDASSAFFERVSQQYFSFTYINRFHYCILLHKSESVRDALQTFSSEGAFATQGGRDALLDVIREARNTGWCKTEVLDELERYAKYAFVLKGFVVTCGCVSDDDCLA